MSGRPVQFLTAAALAVAASFASVSAASAGCYSGCGYSYAAPVAVYSAPVVYSYSYAAPMTYAAPCSPCGYASPMYTVNQGPAFTAPVTLAPEPTPAYEDYRRSYPYYGAGYRRAYPYYAGSGVRWHRHWNRGWGHRYGAAFHARRYAMRAPVVGPRYWHGPRHHMGAPRHHMARPGHVHPMGAPKWPLKRKF